MAKPKPPFALSVWPKRLVAVRKRPIILHVALENVSGKDAYIENRFATAQFYWSPYPFFLMVRCRNKKTHKEVPLRMGPYGKTVEDAGGVEKPQYFPAGWLNGVKLDLAEEFVLGPGEYAVEFQYNTTAVPYCLRPDPLAYHGLTNKVTVMVKVR